jgi:hypothetical protein
MKIQELFNEIKNGNRNAVGELHRRLRIYMLPDGVFSHIYIKFHIEIVDREDTNQDIVLLVWKKIIEGKCDQMNDWDEMKSYSSTICYKKCQELGRRIPNEPINGIKYIAEVEIDLNQEINIKTGLTTEIEEILDEIFKLYSDKCKVIWGYIRKYPSEKNQDKICGFINNDKNYVCKQGENKGSPYETITVENFTNRKSRCKKEMQKKLFNHPEYPNWKLIVKDFFDDIGDN